MIGKLRNMTSIYLTRGDKILLLYREGGRVVNHVWTGSAGGHFEEFELNDAKACVMRELQEELGLLEEDLENLSFKYVTLRKTNGEIRQNYYFFANLKEEVDKDLVSNEGQLQWFSFEAAKELEMPFTAKYVVKHYLATGRFDEKLYAGVTNEVGVEFLELSEF